MKKKVKNLAKDALTLGVTGVGLGVLGSLDSTGSVGKIGKGVGTVGGIVVLSHGIGILNEAMPKKKKHWRY